MENEQSPAQPTVTISQEEYARLQQAANPQPIVNGTQFTPPNLSTMEPAVKKVSIGEKVWFALGVATLLSFLTGGPSLFIPIALFAFLAAFGLFKDGTKTESTKTVLKIFKILAYCGLAMVVCWVGVIIIFIIAVSSGGGF
ncbi:MAG TPA: hypothetical protein VG604_04400 [Candidatus Saccharimonadales bacterium]|nr:hypothetical protein [Candidatus Saccharimonadales bacterium]